jgi:thiaminase/transcriptional activator TenA
MNFTEQLWNSITPIYNAILDLPFIKELTKGTLEEEIFLFYLKQDTMYLAEFSRALAIAGVRSTNNQQMHDFFSFANEVVVVERELHESYYKQYRVGMDAQKSPVCFSYTNFLLSTAATKDNAVNIAALLPCFWIYREVGLQIHKKARPDNPYKDWIATYAGDEFNQSVNRAIEITDQVAEEGSEVQRKQMMEAFVKSTELEWMFWDSAYRQEQWPL